MITASTFKDKKVAVFGLGRTGITAALSLQKGGAEVLAWDDNLETRKSAKAKGVSLVNLKMADWSQINSLVLSPGVPDSLPSPHWSAKLAKDHNVEIICDIEIFAREVISRADENRPRIIAITGTNGKSTTTALIGHILNELGKDAQIGGNIGRGVLDLDYMHPGTYYVLELSSYQLERTNSLRANAAVFLNLSPDHLERHGDMENYERIKRRIFANQTHEDTIVIGVDNDIGRRICTELKAANGRRIIPISGHKSLGRGISALKGKLYSSLGSKFNDIADLTTAENLQGEHNWQNAAAAYAAVQSFGLNAKAIGEAIMSFPGLVHRMEIVGQMGPIRFVNDSKATNATAAEQALKAYDNIYWIAGGVAKAEAIKPLQEYFPKIRKAYLIGEAAPEFHRFLKKSGVNNKVSGTMEFAVLCAVRDALSRGVKNSVILLSPACASFDQFQNFEIRGAAFRSQVKNLMEIYEREKIEHRMRGTAA